MITLGLSSAELEPEASGADAWSALLGSAAVSGVAVAGCTEAGAGFSLGGVSAGGAIGGSVVAAGIGGVVAEDDDVSAGAAGATGAAADRLYRYLQPESRV